MVGSWVGRGAQWASPQGDATKQPQNHWRPMLATAPEARPAPPGSLHTDCQEGEGEQKEQLRENGRLGNPLHP